MANRPAFYAYIDRSISNIISNYDESPLNVTGVQPLQLIKASLTNTLGLLGGLWQNYLDYQTHRLADSVDASVSQRWTTSKLAYEVGISVISAPGVNPTSTGTYFFDGFRIELDEFLLKQGGAKPLFVPFPIKPGRIWIYLDTSLIADPGEPFARIRVEAVGPAVLSSPGAQELALVGVDIDAAGVTTGNTYPVVEPAEEVVYGSRAQRWTGPVKYEGTFTADTLDVEELTAGNGSGVPITVTNVPAGVVGMVITGAGDTFGMTCDGVGNVAAALTNSSASTTLVVAQVGTGRAALMQNNNASSCTLKVEQSGNACGVEADAAGSGPAVQGTNTGTGQGGRFENNDGTSAALYAENAGAGPSLECVGSAKVTTVVNATTGYEGAAGGNPALFPEGASIPTGKSIALVGNASVAGPSTTSLTAGTVNTIDADGVVNVGELAFYSDATTSPTSGVLQWDGRSLTIGDGSLASGRRLPAPIDAFVPGDITTINANTSTGLTASLTLAANESIMIEFFGEMTNSDAVPVILFNIEVNAVVVGGTGNREAPAPGRYMDVSRRYKYTAGGAPVVAAIEVFYGASNGTTTARNLLLTVRRMS